MIQKRVMITEEQHTYIDKSSINFSKFVRSKIQELIDDEQYTDQLKREAGGDVFE